MQKESKLVQNCSATRYVWLTFNQSKYSVTERAQPPRMTDILKYVTNPMGHNGTKENQIEHSTCESIQIDIGFVDKMSFLTYSHGRLPVSHYKRKCRCTSKGIIMTTLVQLHIRDSFFFQTILVWDIHKLIFLLIRWLWVMESSWKQKQKRKGWNFKMYFVVEAQAGRLRARLESMQSRVIKTTGPLD